MTPARVQGFKVRRGAAAMPNIAFPSCPGLSRLRGRSRFGAAKARASTFFLYTSPERRGWLGQARPWRRDGL